MSADQGLLTPQGRTGPAVFAVLEDLRGVVELDAVIDEHRHLALGIHAQHLGMLGAVTLLLGEGHHGEFELSALLAQCDLGLGAEHAQRAGIQLQHSQ
jgi:hypothetical protein